MEINGKNIRAMLSQYVKESPVNIWDATVIGFIEWLDMTLPQKGEHMNEERRKEIIEKLDLIAQDQKDDAVKFEGLPCDGITLAEYFAHQGAAIAALAKIIKALIEEAV